MIDAVQIKKDFFRDKENIFNDTRLRKRAYKFCTAYSLLVEEYIRKALAEQTVNFTVVSAGSFSRRELSPYSDIDLMFIFPSFEGREDEIQNFVTRLWDCGIEVSHTVREFSDIDEMMENDLTSFTQFFETRYLLGDKSIYTEWTKKLLTSLTDETVQRLVHQYFDEQIIRHKKYGDSPKVLEPNVKLSAGGLRDVHLVEWICSIYNRVIVNDQSETTQTESFLDFWLTNKILRPKAIKRLYNSCEYILMMRNLLHLENKHKTDRLEFHSQEKIALMIDSPAGDWNKMMKDYFYSANILYRFSKTMMKRFEERLNPETSHYLEIDLDEDFFKRGNSISIKKPRLLTVSEMLRAYYYRGLHNNLFDEALRTLIIESVLELEEYKESEPISSVFFREILKLSSNVGNTIKSMHELGLLGAFMPEFDDLSGFFQPGVYHCYAADEHSLVALQSIEDLSGNESQLGKIFQSIKHKDLLFLAVLLHDIGKPISISGHEIIGSDTAVSIMERLGYEQKEINLVQFLVRHHLTMEQIAFRRNLNDPATLNDFVSIFPTPASLDYLYLLTYADLSAVNPAVWTQWKYDLLLELYKKTNSLLRNKITGEELMGISDTARSKDAGESYRDHINSINDFDYEQHYTREEIDRHIEEIESGAKLSVLFTPNEGFTNITVITKDIPSLLSRLTGALSINDLNIHSARIFTRKDGLAIDSFNVTDFITQKSVEEDRSEKIRSDFSLAISNELYINREFKKVKSKWWRIEKKLFSRKPKIKVEFERHEKYSIIDIFAPDQLGLLYLITKRLYELGLVIFLAKIATQGDDVVDAFYVLDQNGGKVPEANYELIRVELIEIIEELI